MSWAEVGQIAVASIASAGGIGAIMIAVVSFSTKRIADRMDKKFQATLDKRLEKYKTQLDRGNYISKAVFDKEFEYYQAISKGFMYAFESFDLYYGLRVSGKKVVQKDEIYISNPKLEDIAKAVKNGEAITEIQLENLRNTMLEQFLDVKKVLVECAPFIDPEVLTQYSQLYELCHRFYIEEKAEDYKAIFELRFSVRKSLREYLTSLTVIN